MAVSFFVMGQKLTQFGSSDVEVEVDVKVLNALAGTASQCSHVQIFLPFELWFNRSIIIPFDNFYQKMLSLL